jgi:hypothetical protein
MRYDGLPATTLSGAVMMIRPLLAAVGLLIVVASAAPAEGPAAADVFRSYTSKSGRYKVKLPSKAELTESVTEPEDGPKMFNLFAVVQSPKAVYGIMYFDLPKKPSDAKRAVKEIGDATKGKGKITSSEELDLDEGIVGREWLVELPNATFRYRVLIKDRRAYHVALMSEDEEAATGKDADKYFDSFELIVDDSPKPKARPKVDDGDEPAPKPKPKPKPKVDDEDEPLPKPKPKPKPKDDDPR